MKKIAIIIASHQGLAQALTIHRELPETELFYAGEGQENPCTSINSIPAFVATNFTCYEGLVFIGALGICVRSIAPCIHSKYTDPAVVNIDSTGKHVISVLSGHVGGANELTRRLASILGAAPVITTQSDNNDLWALDTIHERFEGWIPEPVGPMNEIIYKFVNRRPVALLLDIQDSGTRNLERTAPPHVDIYNSFQEIDQNRYEALIIVSPFIYPVVIPTLYYRPHVLSLGFGCRENCDPSGIREYITARLIEAGISRPVSRTSQRLTSKRMNLLSTFLLTV